MTLPKQTMQRSKENLALILMIFWSFINATSFTVTQLVSGEIGPSALAFVRMLIASGCFLPIALIDTSIRLPTPISLIKYAITGSLFGFYLWTTFTAMTSTNSVNIAVIFTLVPGLAGIFSWALLRENMTYSIIAGLILWLYRYIMDYPLPIHPTHLTKRHQSRRYFISLWLHCICLIHHLIKKLSIQ
ncbi:MAG: DMT family transporter [Cellvibrionales bacterium]|nr:DMT family transporter [Cellvibrionales bacterium]